MVADVRNPEDVEKAVAATVQGEEGGANAVHNIRTLGGSQRVLLSSVEENKKFVWGMRAEPARAAQTDMPQPVPFAIRNSK